MRVSLTLLLVGTCFFHGASRADTGVRFRWLPPGSETVDATSTCRFVERVRRPTSKGKALVGGHLSCGEALVRSVLFLASPVPHAPKRGKAGGGHLRDGGVGEALESSARGFALKEVAPSRLRATVDHLGDRGGGRWFAVTSGVVAGPGESEVLASDDNGLSWSLKGAIPKGEKGWQVLLLQFHVDGKGDATAATLHDLDGKGTTVVCQRTRDGRIWRLLDVFSFLRPEERRAGIGSEDPSVRLAAARTCPDTPALPLAEEAPFRVKDDGATTHLVVPETFPARMAWRVRS